MCRVCHIAGFHRGPRRNVREHAGAFLLTTVDLSHRSEIYFSINRDDGMLGRAQPIRNYKLLCAREIPCKLGYNILLETFPFRRKLKMDPLNEMGHLAPSHTSILRREAKAN